MAVFNVVNLYTYMKEKKGDSSEVYTCSAEFHQDWAGDFRGEFALYAKTEMKDACELISEDKMVEISVYMYWSLMYSMQQKY